uniref:Small ribosomal subunit protein uS4c n=1 Tax=Cyphia dentariifolia TaxID=2041117 RepID=A0A291F3W9_9ASTR|nr:ribosomal protein S4 [Cyphia dentariifolia]ATG26813.1 ribosomal protein S4 [Cyphia dentariifolia]
MSRYRGPCFKKIRRLGALPGLTKKKPPDPPKDTPKDEKKSPYLLRLEEKQKLRFHYGLTERQLLKYARIAAKAKGPTDQVLLQLLEMRLDNILFRLGMAPTIPGARQLVNHRHILVNGRIVDIPSYRCKPRDTITAKDEQKSKALIQNSLDSFNKLPQKKLPHKKLKNKKLKNKQLPHKKLPPKKVPYHLTLDLVQYKGVVEQIIDSNRASLGLKIEALRVVEYYSRQTKT